MTSACAAGGDRLGDRAARAPDEVGRVRADHLHAPAHGTPASRRVFSTAMIADLLLAEAGGEEAVGHDGQPVLDRRVEDLPEVAAPDGVRGADRARGGEDLAPTCTCPCTGVVNARSISAPRSASACWSAGADRAATGTRDA